MNNRKDILFKEFEKLKSDLIEKERELGMQASGNWERQLEVIQSGDNVITTELLGEGYTEQLVNGREPGKLPPINAIEDWIVSKKITPPSTMTERQLAWAIATKIKNEGTRYYQQGGTDLLEAVITEQRIEEIINKVGIAEFENFTLEVDELFKRV